MKNWSLQAKLTVWSALIVGVALLLCCTGALWFVRHEQIEMLDDQLDHEARILFGAAEKSGPQFDWAQRERVEAVLPATRTGRFVEITGADGAALYRSQESSAGQLPHLPPGMHTIKVGRDNLRLGVFESHGRTLYLAVALNEINTDQTQLIVVGMVGLQLLVGLTAICGWWLSRQALEPVRAITVAAEQITTARLDRRLPAPRMHDEIGRLTDVLNAMFDRLDAGFRQAARFSADASHELKTPLTVLRSGIEDLLKSPDLTHDDQAAAFALLEQVRRLTNITQTLLLLSRADSGHLQLDRAPADVAEIVVGCTDDARIMAEERGIAIEVEGPDTLIANVDARRIEQVVLNLLDNAVKYNREGGRVRVQTTDAPDALTITVANTGPGIGAEYVPQLFARFFRAGQHADAPGHGLGLSLARELARAHGGDVTLVQSDGEWTTFALQLPGAGRITPPITPAAPPAHPPGTPRHLPPAYPMST